MRGGDQIDIVTPGLLKAEHQTAERFIRDEDAIAAMADFPVLTVSAKEIASAEENGARAVTPDQGRFFSEVRVRCRDFDTGGRLTDASFLFQTIRTALSRTEMATTQDRMEGFSSLG
jgi:hypothetical protein